jgi:hypothetical protein
LAGALIALCLVGSERGSADYFDRSSKRGTASHSNATCNVVNSVETGGIALTAPPPMRCRCGSRWW